jgi:hypothetical protein
LKGRQKGQKQIVDLRPDPFFRTFFPHLTVETEIRQMYGRAATNRDALSGAFVGDIRAAGFDVVPAPTDANPLHVRIIPGGNTFDEVGRDWLSLAFDRLR